jgi:hypothetical protein
MIRPLHLSAWFMILLLAGCSEPPPIEATPDEDLPDPEPLINGLLGEWVDAPASDSSIFHEHWYSDPDGGLTGMGYVMLGADTVSIEHLQILYTDSGTFYSVEMPGQNAGLPVLFRLTSASDSLVFENPLHDFPQRIVYTPRAPGWTARVSSPAPAARSLYFQLMPREKDPTDVR